jgi:oligopeptide transport system ATP-binding protein
MDALLDVKDLRTHFFTSDGVIPAVDGVSFQVDRGETLGIVGESGCGKSVTSLSIMRLVQTPPGRYVSGEVRFEGRNLLTLSERDMRSLRGNALGMVFQEPMTSLNPVYCIGDQIVEAIREHQEMSRADAMEKAGQALALVGMPDPVRRLKEYPHQMSGGMRQRALIAMALACNPRLLIADEPTTALDATIQAQILDLLRRLKDELGMAIILITHDLGVVAEMARRVVVMYAGKVVEEATAHDLFKDPWHPYTEGLLTCIPRMDREAGRLSVIEGTVPNPLHFPTGCRFHPRCRKAVDICRSLEPEMTESGGRRAACHLVSGGNSRSAGQVGAQ